MALDDYGYGKGLFDLIKSGQLKESELDNSEKVKLRSYKITRTGKGVQDLLDAGRMTPEEVDNDPELKLGLQAYNTQRELDKSGTQRFAEALPETLGEAAQGIAKGAAQFPGAGLPKPKQIDLEKAINESEPSAVQQFVGERLPQGVVDYLGDIQPALARGGEYFTGEALKLPKTREPNTIDELVGFAIGVTPQILATGKAVGPAVEGLVTKYGLSSYQSGIVQSLIANLLGTAARTGVEDYFRPPEERQGFTGQMEEIGQLSALDIAGGAVGAGLQKGAAALRRAPDYTQPITIDTIVPGLRDAFRKAEATLAGTPDALPPGFVDEAINSIEIEAQKAFRAAVQEAGPEFQAPRAPTEPAKKPATKTQPRVVIPEEFQTPETRRTPLEQEFGLPKGSETGEAPEPAPQEAVKTPPEAQVAPPRAEVPENRAEVPPKAPEPPKETYGLEDKHIQALKDREADARVIADIEERYGISIARKAKSEVLDADKVAAASDEITAGRTPKDTKLTRAERKADPALENLLNNRAQKNARRAAREAGVSDEDFKALRNNLGESAIAEETASGAISARRERVVRTILDKSTSIDDDTRALLRSELEDVQKSRTAPKTEQAVAKKDIFSDKKIPLGASEEVVTPSNTKAKTKFAVVDASDLKTSFDEGFPPELQNRLRGTRIASTAQIEEITSKFDAKRLGSSREVGSGSPVVDREGNVLVGNGRTTAIRRVLAQDDLPAGEYRDFIKENAERFGIDPKRVDDLDNPILVRVLDEDVEGPKFISEANKPTAQVLSATEKALDDANKLSDDTLALIRPDDLELDNSSEFTNRFAKEVVGPTEMNAFVDSRGNVSAEGKRRIRNAVFARAYNDVDVIENVVESNDPNFKNISKVLFNTSPAFAKTKGGKFGINEKIVDALDQLVQAKKRGIRLDQQLAQRTIGGTEPDEITKSLALIFDQNKGKPAVLGRFMERLSEAMQNAEVAAGQQGLFGGDKINTDDIIEIVLRRVADEGNISTPKIEGAPKGEAALGPVGAKQPVRPGKGKPRARESAAISEEVVEQFREAQELGDAGTNTRALLDPTSTHAITRESAKIKQDFIDKNVREGLKTIQEKSEKGAIVLELGRENVSPTSEQITSPNPEIEAAMTASKKILPKMQVLIDAVKNNPVTRQYKAWFNWEPLLQKNHKELLPEFRRFAGKHYDVNELSRTEVFAAVHPLLKDTNPKASLDVASRYIAAQNMKYDIETTGKAIFDEAGEQIGKAPGRTVRDIPLDEVKAEIKRLEGLFTPNIRKQLELHKQLIQLNWKELIYERGLSNSATSPNEWYFPKEVLDYAQRFKEFQPFVSRKLAAPIRRYLIPRTGSVRDINMDYLDVMQRGIARLHMDKAVEDFAKTIMERKAVPVNEMMDAVAETWRIPKADVAKLKIDDILVPGNIYHHGDNTYKVFRYRTSREIFGGAGVTEKFLGDIITNSDPQSSLLASKKGRTALLPIDLAERLEQFNQPKELGMLERTIGGPTRAWKRFIINASGIAFQTTQVAGDAFLGFGLERPSALLELPRAFRAMMNGRKGVYDEVFDAFMKERLTDAGYIGEYGPAIIDPRFKPFQTKSQWAGKKVSDLLAADPFGWLHALNEIREGTERGALYLSYMKDVKAYQAAVAAGKNPKLPRSKMVDLEGILVEDIPGEVARRALVDYNRITPQYASQIRGALLPFVTYYIQSTGNIARYIARNPVEATWKLALPYAAMQLWNNLYYGDIEADMPLDQRIKPHVITGLGYKDKPLIVQWQLPWDTLISVTGIGNAVDNIRQVAKGEMTHEEAFKNWLKSIPKNTADLFVGLLNPFIGRSIDLIRNKDSYTGKQIVPDKEKGTARGAKKQADYLATKLFRTYNEIRGWTNPIPERGRPTNTWGLTSYSLEGLLHYKPADEGYRKYGQFSNKMQKAIDLEAQVNDKQARLMDAYTEWQVTGDRQVWTGMLEAIKNEPGPAPTPAQIKASIGNINTQLEITRRKWVKATGPERDKLEEKYNRLLEQRRKENILRKPKAIRPYLFDANGE